MSRPRRSSTTAAPEPLPPADTGSYFNAAAPRTRMAENIFGGSDTESSGSGERKKLPILDNDSEGAAAWLHRDKNGNAYLSVKLPLGLGSLNLFPSNDTVKDALNQLMDYLEDQDD